MNYYGYRTLGFGPGGITKAVKYLLLANVGIFFLELLWGAELIYLFGLTPALVKKGFIWQIFTYMFLHGGFFHILFNMFALWMFGCEIERAWGTKEFLRYYFITGVGAGFLTFLLSFNSHIPTIGASGAIFGILVAFAMMFPDRPIYLYFLFPIKAKYLVIFFAVIEFLASFRHTSDGIGHFAHLGGMLIGYIYISARGARPAFGGGSTYGRKSDWRWSSFFRLSRYLGYLRELRYRHRMKVINKKRERERKVLDRVDQILDKINRVGFDNLTKEEKKTLEQASQLLSQQTERK